jgi:four helix bundle protein
LGTVGGFEDLLVWQRAMALVRDVYRISRGFPSDERFGLTAQLRRAIVSIPSNLAEGHERHTTPDYMRFVSIASGSLAEARTQLLIACSLEYCAQDQIQNTLGEMGEINRMLQALRRSLTARQKR